MLSTKCNYFLDFLKFWILKFLFHWIWKKKISRQKLFNLIIICYYFDRLYATLHQVFFKSKILWIYFWYSHSGQSWSNSCCSCYSMVPWAIFQLLWQNFTAKKPSRFCLKRWEFLFCISEQLFVSQKSSDKQSYSKIENFQEHSSLPFFLAQKFRQGFPSLFFLKGFAFTFFLKVFTITFFQRIYHYFLHLGINFIFFYQFYC